MNLEFIVFVVRKDKDFNDSFTENLKKTTI